MPYICVCKWKLKYYIKLNIVKLEQNLVRQNDNTHLRSDIQSEFCRTDI